MPSILLARPSAGSAALAASLDPAHPQRHSLPDLQGLPDDRTAMRLERTHRTSGRGLALSKR
ncbi:MAG: hypothetical protein AB7O45_02290 [Alphaproteobacteria bacterium]